MNDRRVPLVDLAWQHTQVDQDVRRGWDEMLADTSFILGPPVGEFESGFAEFSGVRHCIGVGSGTDALEIAIRALGVGPGDDVILPANTFIATALAVTRAGATPVLVDCSPDTYLIDVEAIEAAITERTRAIIPVHLYGQMAPAREIRDAFPDIWVVEDAAQSQGARRLGESSGSIGHLGATSFYPGKNIGAYGDAGAVLTNDDRLAEQARKLRNWGSEVKYHHPEKGFNSRLDTVQAVVLSAKLRRLAAWNELRSEAARLYGELLADLPVQLPVVADGNDHVWHLFVTRVPERERVLGELNANGVGAGIHYPTPIHLHGAYSDLGHGPGSFPNSEQLSQSALSLPIYPGITPEDQEYVADCLKKALR